MSFKTSLIYLLYFHWFIYYFAEYARRVYKYFKNKGVRRIIVLDPHTYDIMKFVYPNFVDDYDLEVQNIIDILLTANSKFRKLEVKATIHDPCQYTRNPHRKIIDEPRKILDSLGVDLVEPMATKNMTWCCGGPVEALFGIVAEKIAEKRVKQLLATNRKNIVVLCPVCHANLGKAIKEMGVDARLIDLIDLAYKSIVKEGE